MVLKKLQLAREKGLGNKYIIIWQIVLVESLLDGVRMSN